MSNWEEAHRIKTNASKSALMFLSHKTKPKSKYLTLHPKNKKAAQEIISYKTLSLWLADGFKPGSIAALLPQCHGPL